MIIKFNDLRRQYESLRNEIDSSIKRVNNSGYYLFGDELKSFEEEFASYCNCKYAIGVANCTDALAISLMAYDIGGGDEVITSTNTAIPTGMAISQTGAKPIFIDILKEEQTMNPELIEEKINKRTKAIIPVHLYGLPSKLDEINNIAGKYNIKVIEDAAQADGSFYKNK